MTDATRWGILGTGSIARTFAAHIPHAPGAKLVAVGSRTSEAANSFADEFAIPRRHGNYDELATDPDVEAIYVATPHPMHKANTIL